ncbi:acidic mammalian chitinase-like [Argiope bruennichi]|uniref:acidic mammalian chitinase-like n=1 Tax=Argiope bruennichi TaxID=94029 RepID=UPI0024956074|nr:acidic mammalian chitinase-like [Argiope bruennichi]
MRKFWLNMNAFIKLLILLCSTISIFCSTQPKEKPDLLRVCYYTVDNPAPILLNTTLCTHIIAGFSVVTNGVLDLGNDYKKKLYFQTTDLKKNNPELKVLLTVGGGGSNGGFSEALNSTSNRTKFIISTLATLGKYNFDGFDIDWEFPVWNDGIKEDKSNFISFLKEFRALSTFYAHLVGKPPPLLTVAVAAVQNIITSSYDIPGMAKYVDFINLMSYDYHDFFWYTPFTGHNSPLFNSSREKDYFSTLNTAWSANYWHEQGMPKSKIMVGIPTYAHTYVLVNPRFHGVDDPAAGTKDDISFSDVCKFLSSGGTRVFDNESQVPYAYKDYDWVSYEDPVSISGKAKWIKSEGYGGAMTYNLNSDDWSCVCDKTPFLLHRIIYDIFTK